MTRPPTHTICFSGDGDERADLYQAVMNGDNVAMTNFANPLAVADAAIAELRAIINGNGLGKFGGLPCCADWFKKPTSPKMRIRGGGGTL